MTNHLKDSLGCVIIVVGVVGVLGIESDLAAFRRSQYGRRHDGEVQGMINRHRMVILAGVLAIAMITIAIGCAFG